MFGGFAFVVGGFGGSFTDGGTSRVVVVAFAGGGFPFEVVVAFRGGAVRELAAGGGFGTSLPIFRGSGGLAVKLVGDTFRRSPALRKRRSSSSQLGCGVRTPFNLDSKKVSTPLPSTPCPTNFLANSTRRR